jgi:hypothetical protein
VDQERNEVYERIPWETLEEKKSDRQWLMFGIAGAVVLGALAYSMMSNRPVAAPVAATVPVAQETVPVAQATVPAAPAPALPPAVPASPVLTAEADLYAVHPERLADSVAAHAEWFVSEYLTVDGSEQGRATLTALMPAGVPLPVAPEGTRVFVEWVRTVSIEEMAPLTFRATVLARSLAAQGEGVYERQAPLEVSVEVMMSADGPQITLPPEVSQASSAPVHQPNLEVVPEEIAAAALESSGGSEILGGLPGETGTWRVVVLAPGADGVSRPITVSVP